MRLVKTWKADILFPFAIRTYSELEEILGSRFWFGMNILKIPRTPDELQTFEQKSVNPEFFHFLISDSKKNISCLKQTGNYEITSSGYLDLANLISEYRIKLLNDKMLLPLVCQINNLDISSNKVTWNGTSFGKVIFCDGFHSVVNPLFSWLPFVPAKGELLSIQCEHLPPDRIIMKDIFLIPVGNQLFKAGSTYSWDYINEDPTSEGYRQLIEKIDNLLDCPYSVVEHHAGIRPTVKDRKPFLGLHPVYRNIGIFNGLGAKGASLSPYYAHHLAEYLEEGKALDSEVDIKRYLKLYYPQS